MADDINYRFTENGIEYDFYDVFVPAELFRQPSLWSWGYNNNGQLGVNDIVSRSTPVTTILGGTNWKSVAYGTSHMAAIKTDGTLWLSGNNGDGQLGVNDRTTRSTPVTTILGGNNWKSVAGGSNYTAAIKTDGSLWLWGSNSYGQLGINDRTTRSIPVTTILGGTNWKSASCSNRNHTLAIKTDGTLWLWGNNDDGQLGINENGTAGQLSRSTPVTTILGGNNWKTASCSSRGHTLAIKTDGTLWLWGNNFAGQLGINDGTTRFTPVTTILGGNDWNTGCVSEINSSAIKTDGTLWNWGYNFYGTLGINNNDNNSIPVTTILGGTNWKSVSCSEHTVAIKTDGTLWLWGRNDFGQLGVNNITSRSTPVTTILGGNNWKIVSSGGYATVAIQYEPDP